MQPLIKHHTQYVGQSVLCLVYTVCVTVLFARNRLSSETSEHIDDVPSGVGCYDDGTSIYQGEGRILKYDPEKTSS